MSLILSSTKNKIAPFDGVFNNGLFFQWPFYTIVLYYNGIFYIGVFKEKDKIIKISI